jgi:hypothetical protein
LTAISAISKRKKALLKKTDYDNDYDNDNDYNNHNNNDNDPDSDPEFCIINPLIGAPRMRGQRCPGTAVDGEVRPGKSTGLFSWTNILIAFTDEYPYPLLFAFLGASASWRESQIQALRARSKLPFHTPKSQ